MNCARHFLFYKWMRKQVVSCHQDLTINLDKTDVLTGTLFLLKLVPFFLLAPAKAAVLPWKPQTQGCFSVNWSDSDYRLPRHSHQFVQKPLIAMTLAITSFLVLSSFVFLVRLESIDSQEESWHPWPLLNENHKSQCKIDKRIKSQVHMVEIEGKNLRDDWFHHSYFMFFFLDCVQVVAQPGTYIVRPTIPTQSGPCGVYLAGLHNEIIIIDIQFLDVSCENEGIVAVRTADTFRTIHILCFCLVFRWLGNEWAHIPQWIWPSQVCGPKSGSIMQGDTCPKWWENQIEILSERCFAPI